MTSVIAFLESLLKKLVITAIGLMLLLVFAQVITRYLFGYTPSFGEELARYLFVWVVFLSLPLVAKAGGHMAIETLTSRISGTPLKVCRLAADIFSMVFLAIMTRNGVIMVSRAHFQTSPAMMVPMSYVYAVIPFGCAVMLLYVVGNFFRTLRGPKAPSTKRPETGK